MNQLRTNSYSSRPQTPANEDIFHPAECQILNRRLLWAVLLANAALWGLFIWALWRAVRG
jgi:hypothetical protein